MYFSVQRAARSSYVKEAADFATALLDPNGDIFAYPPSATFAFLIDTDFKATLDAVPHVEQGDVIIANNPCTRRVVCPRISLRSLHLFQPYFAGDRVIAWGWSFVHCADIGGAVRQFGAEKKSYVVSSTHRSYCSAPRHQYRRNARRTSPRRSLDHQRNTAGTDAGPTNALDTPPDAYGSLVMITSACSTCGTASSVALKSVSIRKAKVADGGYGEYVAIRIQQRGGEIRGLLHIAGPRSTLHRKVHLVGDRGELLAPSLEAHRIEAALSTSCHFHSAVIPRAHEALLKPDRWSSE